MNEKYLYLALDSFTLLGPLFISFHPLSRYYRTWFALFPAILLVAALFVVWDIDFTQRGIWGFNPRYLSGLQISVLPIEEWLFFMVVPYACLFIYHSTKVLTRPDFFVAYSRPISALLLVAMLSVLVLTDFRWYTTLTFAGLSVALLLFGFVLKKHFMGRFYFSYALSLLPFVLMNGALTGSFTPEPVVWYNNAHNLATRFFTIPVEDFFYAMLLLLLNTALYELFLHLGKHPQADWR